MTDAAREIAREITNGLYHRLGTNLLALNSFDLNEAIDAALTAAVEREREECAKTVENYLGPSQAEVARMIRARKP
jgi:hypothetical protein